MGFNETGKVSRASKDENMTSVRNRLVFKIKCTAIFGELWFIIKVDETQAYNNCNLTLLIGKITIGI